MWCISIASIVRLCRAGDMNFSSLTQSYMQLLLIISSGDSEPSSCRNRWTSKIAACWKSKISSGEYDLVSVSSSGIMIAWLYWLNDTDRGLACDLAGCCSSESEGGSDIKKSIWVHIYFHFKKLYTWAIHPNEWPPTCTIAYSTLNISL